MTHKLSGSTLSLNYNDIHGIVLWPQSPAYVGALDRLRDVAPLILIDRTVSGFETNSVVFAGFACSRAVAEHLQGRWRIDLLSDEVFAETV